MGDLPRLPSESVKASAGWAACSRCGSLLASKLGRFIDLAQRKFNFEECVCWQGTKQRRFDVTPICSHLRNSGATCLRPTQELGRAKSQNREYLSPALSVQRHRHTTSHFSQATLPSRQPPVKEEERPSHRHSTPAPITEVMLSGPPFHSPLD